MGGSEICKSLIRENFPETINLNEWSKSHIPISDNILNEFIDTNQTKVFLIISDPREIAMNLLYFDNGLHIEPRDYSINTNFWTKEFLEESSIKHGYPGNYLFGLDKNLWGTEFLGQITDKQIELIETFKRQFGDNCIVLKYEDALFYQDEFLNKVSDFLNLEPLGIDDAEKYKTSIHKNIGNFHMYFRENVLRAHYEQYKSFYDTWGYDYGGYVYLKYEWHGRGNTLERTTKNNYKELLRRNGVTPSDRTKDIDEF